jgi:hypothetical protein
MRICPGIATLSLLVVLGIVVTGCGNQAGGGSGSGGDGCKRGLASNRVPTSGWGSLTWWYNWSANGTPPAGVEFVPMVWGQKSLGDTLPAGARWVLGFNEPNFKSQANLTPQQAADAWPEVEAKAKAAGLPIVSPAVNFCGSAGNSSGCSDPAVTDPYTWLQDFFAACKGCQVDAIAIHWYNCDLPSLKGYIEGNGKGLAGFVQFGKPLWLTEFSCDGSHSAADQKTYMEAAIPYLEASPNVARYSWFSSSNIASAQLTNGDGTPNALGQAYLNLAQACHQP